jgi:hypothetical protein
MCLSLYKLSSRSAADVHTRAVKELNKATVDVKRG